MKTRTLLVSILCIALSFQACEKNPFAGDKTGILEFKTYNPFTSSQKSTSMELSVNENPALTGHTTETYTTSMKVCIGDIWVSMGEVNAGEPDTLNWIRLTETTNREIKLIEDYSFLPVELPVGTYKSIKLTFRNVFYRYAQLISDETVAYELLETMGSWTDACDENDTTWANTNYFGPDGNHYLNDDGNFYLVSEGEKVGGFEIIENKTATVTFRFMAGATTPCTTILIDENDNLQWDCGVDRMDFVCPPENLYMFDFLIEYEE